jgi:nucleoside 2-deoxyribosyltransferase
MNFVFAYSANPQDPFFLEHLEKIITESKNCQLNILNETKLSNKKNGQHLFQKIKNQIDQADCLIAEVTKASLDVGGEIVYALMKDIPVLALIYKENIDNLTPMLANNPSEHLFLEHYDEKNLKFIIKNFGDHLSFLKNRRGKMVVIDGGDGSGKATQTQLLIDYLKKKTYDYQVYDFPR